MTALREEPAAAAPEPDPGPPSPGPRVERRAARRAVRTFRPRRMVLAIIVAVLLLTVAVLTAVEVITWLTGDPLQVVPYERLDALARERTYDDPAMLALFGVIALAGLVLLVAALVPGRPRMVPLATGDPDLVVGLSRTGLKHALRAAAAEVPGVGQATVRLRRRKVVVHVSGGSQVPGEPAEGVRQAVTARLRELAPVRPPRVKVVTSGGAGR